jgi:hypothetical protein
MMKANGLLTAVGNQKKQRQIAMPPRWEAIWNSILGHGVPAMQKNSAIKENERLP